MTLAGQGRRSYACARLGSLLVLWLALTVLAAPARAAAVAPAPAWSIDAVSRPTYIAPTTNGYISLVVSNDGGAATSGPITITDSLPPQLRVNTASWHALPGKTQGECEFTEASVTCTYTGVLAAQNTQALSIAIEVQPSGVPGAGVNSAIVSGGGAAPEKAESAVIISSAAAPFGLSDFHFDVLDAAGGPDTQAGDHPNAVTVGVDFNTVPKPLSSESFSASEPPKSVSLELPLGLIGNPHGIPTCQQYELTSPPVCPPDTVVGTVVYRSEEVGVTVSEPKASTGVTPLFNMSPEHGYPAEFAFEHGGHVADIYTSVVHRATGYAMRMYAPSITPAAALTGMQLTFFGDPSTSDSSGEAPTDLFTTPFDCSPMAAPLTAAVSAASWTAPAGAAPVQASVIQPSPTGCASLQFAPALDVDPETRQVDTPTGLTVHMAMAQDEAVTGLATAPLKDATVTLPVGMSLSLPAGNGLRGCPPDGPEGIELYEEQPGADGFAQAVAGHCPRASRIGSATVVTPLLTAPLQGSVYLAQPLCGPCDEAQVEAGKLIRVYVEAEGSGINLKLPGEIEVGGAGSHATEGPAGEPALAPGQLRLQLLENPQLPTSEVELELNGGQQALLENPARCGVATSTSYMDAWGQQTPGASPESFFGTTWDEAGKACPQTLPFAPSFSAGTADALAGAHSPFTMTFARHDREQALSSISMRTPPGFAAEMAGVPQCPEQQASLGQCPAASAVGHVHVALGPGSQPLWVEGPVYLTGPYDGAPFGLSLVIPAKAGPFDLGNVVVRATIALDPHTAALSIDAGPLPSSASAVPLRIQTVSISLDRPAFTLDPTRCSQQQVTATIASAAGTGAAASTPFAVAACANLPFKAQLTAHSEAKTSRNGGAMLHLKLSSGVGQANVAKLRVVLPRQLPTRLSALQHACPARLFDVNPASCPTASVVGQGMVHTKMLSSPLAGPAYFVSHGGVKFPDIELVLQGEGVLLDLDGATTIANNITTATFDSLPDVQLQTLSLMLPEGPHSLLGANGSLCASKLSLSTALMGQSGAKAASASTPLAVGGCPRRPRKGGRAKGSTSTLSETFSPFASASEKHSSRQAKQRQ